MGLQTQSKYYYIKTLHITVIISNFSSYRTLSRTTYCLEFWCIIITKCFVEVIIQSDVCFLADFISRFTVWNTLNHPTLQKKRGNMTQLVDKSTPLDHQYFFDQAYSTDYHAVTQITCVSTIRLTHPWSCSHHSVWHQIQL